jgi:hypothetical protein
MRSTAVGSASRPAAAEDFSAEAEGGGGDDGVVGLGCVEGEGEVEVEG